MRQLIVGCGYLGRRVAQLWLDRGDEVFALTRSPERAREFSENGIVPLVGDVLQPASLQFPEGIDTCLYAVGLDRSAGFSQREVYVDGLRNVLTAESFRPTRLIYISSTSVYGQSAGEWIDEDSATEPVRDNGRVCLDAEQLVGEFGRTQPGVRASVLRLSGIYGPQRLLARVEQLRSGAPLGGSPEAWLNLIHVADAARAVLACEEHGRGGRVYLVSDDRPVQRREYYTELARRVGAPEPRFEPDAETLGKRCSNRRLHEELGLELQFPTLAAGLDDALAGTSGSY